MEPPKRICIIGAGTAGLCAARHASQHNLEVTVYEQSNTIGGTWVWSEETGKNEFEIDIHTSMYKGLCTNLPKEIMGFPDFPMPAQEKSYIPAEDVMRFLHSYAENFDLKRQIKFSHQVIRVLPKNGVWEVSVKDILSEKLFTKMFDFMLVCNGHYHAPVYANLEGNERFGGKIIHSHDYRDAELFKGERVLVIGGGASGLDITNMLSHNADAVYFSHHSKIASNTTYNSHVIQKPDTVRILDSKTVEFADGSTAEVTTIIHCTGYRYSFPFLSAETKLQVEDNCFVQPLYKHCININYPTMALIGIPFVACLSLMMDMQVRFVLQYFTGKRELPSKEEMILDTDVEMQSRWNRGYTKKQAHFLGPDQVKYFDDLSATAGIENIKPVFTNIFNGILYNINNYNSYRNDVFKIVDDESFRLKTNNN